MKIFKAFKYGASWCSQCKMLDKELERNPLNCELQVLDVDDLDNDSLEHLKIRNIPVVILQSAECKDKEPPVFREEKRWTGFTRSEEINKYIAENS